MQESFGITLIKNTGYKKNRYGISTYQMLETDNDTIKAQEVTLDALRNFLTIEGFPLKNDD